MKKIILLCSIVIAINMPAMAQIYADYDIGSAFKTAVGTSPVNSLHIGYQFNNVLDINGIAMAEYDQRVIIQGLSPVYLGGRVGYGLNVGEFTTISGWGGYYTKLTSSDPNAVDNSNKSNYGVPGYGVSFVWKSITAEVSKVEFYQFTIGCHYLLDD